ncbi:MAG: CaiB/BaiF CoA-transferase family protein [Pseudomonadota bacterium]
MGPLKGVKVIEVGGIGPGPFCAMMLSDMGAEVVRLERKGGLSLYDPKFEILHRGRKSVNINLRKTEGVEAVLRMVEQADVLTEGFRPGVMERLGLGPDACLARNPKLVYGRMTGWGQEGPLASAAGHDINYIALSGALHAIGRCGDRPTPPLNLVGDFGGGGMLLAFGIAAALYEAQKSGRGQVVDAAMVDGSALLTSMFYGFKAAGLWNNGLGTNFLDGGAHFYDSYETKDGKWVSIGSIEPQFYAELLRLAGLDNSDFEAQFDRAKWPELKEKIMAVFKTKTRGEWVEIMEGSDVCFAPVLDFDEARRHPHNVCRETFVEIEGVPQPGPAPRFSRTKPEIQGRPPQPGEHTESALAGYGFSAEEIESLRQAGAI